MSQGRATDDVRAAVDAAIAAHSMRPPSFASDEYWARARADMKASIVAFLRAEADSGSLSTAIINDYLRPTIDSLAAWKTGSDLQPSEGGKR